MTSKKKIQPHGRETHPLENKTAATPKDSLDHIDPMSLAVGGRDFELLKDCSYVYHLCPDAPPHDMPPDEVLAHDERHPQWNRRKLENIGWRLLHCFKSGDFE